LVRWLVGACISHSIGLYILFNWWVGAFISHGSGL
jgi:hypothetical protein